MIIMNILLTGISYVIVPVAARVIALKENTLFKKWQAWLLAMGNAAIIHAVWIAIGSQSPTVPVLWFIISLLIIPKEKKNYWNPKNKYSQDTYSQRVEESFVDYKNQLAEIGVSNVQELKDIIENYAKTVGINDGQYDTNLMTLLFIRMSKALKNNSAQSSLITSYKKIAKESCVKLNPSQINSLIEATKMFQDNSGTKKQCKLDEKSTYGKESYKLENSAVSSNRYLQTNSMRKTILERVYTDTYKRIIAIFDETEYRNRIRFEIIPVLNVLGDIAAIEANTSRIEAMKSMLKTAQNECGLERIDLSKYDARVDLYGAVIRGDIKPQETWWLGEKDAVESFGGDFFAKIIVVLGDVLTQENTENSGENNTVQINDIFSIMALSKSLQDIVSILKEYFEKIISTE